MEGKGVDINNTEAVRWYRLAADQGNGQAQNNLGSCYEFGKGVEKDLSEAIKWYRIAAQNGIEMAKRNLKRMGDTESYTCNR